MFSLTEFYIKDTPSSLLPIPLSTITKNNTNKILKKPPKRHFLLDNILTTNNLFINMLFLIKQNEISKFTSFNLCDVLNWLFNAICCMLRSSYEFINLLVNPFIGYLISKSH